jgi:hypothetical protein
MCKKNPSLVIKAKVHLILGRSFELRAVEGQKFNLYIH